MKRLILMSTLMFMCIQLGHTAWTESSRATTGMEITLSTITTRVRQIIDDPNSTYGTVRYSSATIYGLVDTGHKMLCIQTQALSVSATTQLTANTTTYTLPTNCMFIEKVTVDKLDGLGEQYISMKTTWRLDLEAKTWSIHASSQVPTAYYVYGRELGVYPVPDHTGAILKIYYIKSPTTLDSEDDLIFDGMTNMQPYWDLLATYAASKIYLQEGNSGMAQALATEWVGGIKDLMSFIRYAPNYTPENIMGN